MVLFLVSTVLEAVAELPLFLLEVLLFWVAVDLFWVVVLLFWVAVDLFWVVVLLETDWLLRLEEELLLVVEVLPVWVVVLLVCARVFPENVTLAATITAARSCLVKFFISFRC